MRLERYDIWLLPEAVSDSWWFTLDNEALSPMLDQSGECSEQYTQREQNEKVQ